MEKYCSQPEEATESIMAFDTLYTTNHMKILKLLIPYLNTEFQHKLAVYIKWQELIFTLNMSQNACFSSGLCQLKKKQEDTIFSLLPSLLPYCTEKEKAQLSTFSNMLNIMNSFSQMKEYMPLIQSFLSQMQGGEQMAGDNNMLDMLKNMMSEEQLGLFSMFMNGG